MDNKISYYDIAYVDIDSYMHFYHKPSLCYSLLCNHSHLEPVDLITPSHDLPALIDLLLAIL